MGEDARGERMGSGPRVVGVSRVGGAWVGPAWGSGQVGRGLTVCVGCVCVVRGGGRGVECEVREGWQADVATVGWWGFGEGRRGVQGLGGVMWPRGVGRLVGELRI